MKRVKIPFMHDMDGRQKPSQSLMQKECEMHTFDFLFLSSVSLLEGIMGFFRPAGDGKSVKQRPWYESLCFRLLRIRNCVSLTAQMDL
jgi:hypothetical protein